jgi:hypothetical protein
LVAVIVYAVALCVAVGVPVKSPVAVLKVVPEGAAGEIAKLAIVPPVDVIVYPEIDVFTVLVSAIALNVNAGAASVGVELPEDGGGVYAEVVIF